MLTARFCRTVPTHIAVVEYTREPRAALILRSGRSPRLEGWGGLMHPDSARPRPSRRSPGSRFAQPVSLLRTRASNHAPQHVGGQQRLRRCPRAESSGTHERKRDTLTPPHRNVVVRTATTIRVGNGKAVAHPTRKVAPCRPCSRFTKMYWRTARRSRCRRPRA